MSLETRLSESLHGTLDATDLPPGDLAAVTRLGRSRQRRTRGIVGVAAAVVIAAGVAASLWAPVGDPEPAPGPGTGSWREVAPMPLAPRMQPVTGWTGEEALVVGGQVDGVCPASADCTFPPVYADDGAAYDPETDAWRPIADAPLPIAGWFRSTMVGDTLVLQARQQFFAYDASDDEWRALPAPAEPVGDAGAISALGGEVYVLGRDGSVWALDITTGSWRQLPLDDQRPRLDPSTVLATPEGIFLSGDDPAVPSGQDAAAYVVVDRFDGERWTRLPVTGQVWPYWDWTGEHLVSTDPQTATGLDGNPPHGGILDPATGVWEPLPDRPTAEGWSPNAAAGPLIASWGVVYDDTDRSWEVLGRPTGAPELSGQGAVWAGDQLVVVGGIDGRERLESLTDRAWVWTP